MALIESCARFEPRTLTGWAHDRHDIPSDWVAEKGKWNAPNWQKYVVGDARDFADNRWSRLFGGKKDSETHPIGEYE